MTIEGCSYVLKRYQGEHEDDYSLKKDNKVCLLENGILKMIFEVGEEGAQIGEFTRFENGCVAFVQSFDDIYEQSNYNRIVNHVRGERMEIYSHESNHLIYHGEFNEKREREGWGIEYDAKPEPCCWKAYGRGTSLWRSFEDRRNYHDRVQTKWKQHHRFQSNSSVCGRIRV